MGPRSEIGSPCHKFLQGAERGSNAHPMAAFSGQPSNPPDRMQPTATQRKKKAIKRVGNLKAALAGAVLEQPAVLERVIRVLWRHHGKSDPKAPACSFSYSSTVGGSLICCPPGIVPPPPFVSTAPPPCPNGCSHTMGQDHLLAEREVKQLNAAA